MTKELFKKTDDSQSKKYKYERLTISLDEQTSKMLESFFRQVRDDTGYKISKAEIVVELIRLLPEFNIDTFYLGSREDVKNQFDNIRKKISVNFKQIISNGK